MTHATRGWTIRGLKFINLYRAPLKRQLAMSWAVSNASTMMKSAKTTRDKFIAQFKEIKKKINLISINCVQFNLIFSSFDRTRALLNWSFTIIRNRWFYAPVCNFPGTDINGGNRAPTRRLPQLKQWDKVAGLLRSRSENWLTDSSGSDDRDLMTLPWLSVLSLRAVIINFNSIK